MDRAINWWVRRCGGREVLVLALPLIVSTASWTVMHFVDRMFLLWYSTRAMAAAMPAGMLHFTLVCLPLGVAVYANTFVAQYKGAGRPKRIGVVVWQSVWIGLSMIPVFLATIPLAPGLFSLVGHDPAVARLEVLYYQTLTFGAGGAITAAALSTFFTGRGVTRVVMMVDSTAAVINVVLDYAWIFGNFGFPEMGIQGAALGTVTAQWFRAICYWRLMMRSKNIEKYQLVAGRRFDPRLFRRLLRYGGPNGLQMLVEVSAFTVFILLVGRLGEQAMAATVLAFNVNSVAFLPMLGMGIAVSTMVGQQLGRNRPDLAARVAWTAFWMTFAYMGTMAILYVATPDLFLMGHAAGTQAAEFGPLRDVTVVLLRFVAAYCLFDAMNLIFVSAIKGAGDTRFILITTLILSPMPVLAGWWGVTRCGWGLIWCWWVITAWVCALGITYLTRFLQGHWRTMRVIEAEPLVEGPLAEEEDSKPMEPPIQLAGDDRHTG